MKETITITQVKTSHGICRMEAPGQSVEIENEQVVPIIEHLTGQGYKVRVATRHLELSLNTALCEYAGLSSYQAAKQFATGYIEF